MIELGCVSAVVLLDATQERVGEAADVMTCAAMDATGSIGIARALGLACYTETRDPDHPDQAT